MVLAEGSSKAVVAELSDGDECSILKIRENIGTAGGKGDLGEQKKCGLRGLHIGNIGQADKDAIQGVNFFGAVSVIAKEMAGAAGFRDSLGLMGSN